MHAHEAAQERQTQTENRNDPDANLLTEEPEVIPIADEDAVPEHLFPEEDRAHGEDDIFVKHITRAMTPTKAHANDRAPGG